MKLQTNETLREFLTRFVAQATTEEIRMADFVETNEVLKGLFETEMTTPFSGFNLSETFQVLWLDPEAYLTEGSFIQRMLANLGVRPEDITEATLADSIYRILRQVVVNFPNNALLKPSLLPSLSYLGLEAEDLAAFAPVSPSDIPDPNLEGIPEEEPPLRECGKFLLLTLAAGASITERVSCDYISRDRVTTSSRSVLGSDSQALRANSPTMTGVTILMGTVANISYRRIREAGAAGLEVIHGSRGESLTEGDQRGSISAYVAEYTYQDSTGELHVHTTENRPIEFEAMLRTITDLETRITQAEVTARTTTGPASPAIDFGAH